MTPPNIRANAPNAADVPRTAAVRVAIDEDVLATRGADSKDTRLPITFSSEHPVERYDWWADERYLEILDHSPGAIDLSRAERGLPFVDTHNVYSVNALLGRVEEVRLRSDGKLAGLLKLSQRQEAQDFQRDLIDGIAGEVSVGYRIDPTRVDRVTAEGQMTRYIVRRWTPHEVSGVSVPADPTVGVGRSLDSAPKHALPVPFTRADAVVSARSVSTTTDQRIVAPNGQEVPVDKEESKAPDTGGTPVIEVTRNEAPDNDLRRRSLAEQAEKHQVQDIFARGIAENKDLDVISRDMMSALKERADKGPQFGGRVTLTESEQRKYSVAKAILAATGESDAGFEVDVSQELGRNLPQGYSAKGSGIFIPTNLTNGSRAAIVQGTGTLGGNLTFIEPGSFIDYLRNKTFVLQAGATLLPGLRSSISFPKQTGTGAIYWVGEAPGSDTTETNMTFGLVSLTPKTMQATQAFSRQLLTQAEFVPNIEQLVRGDLASLHALAIDQAAISGLGSSNQPLGLTKSTAVGTVTLGAAGAVPTYDVLVDQEVQIRAANIDGQLAYLTTPGIAGKLKKTQKFATTNGEAVWTGDLINGQLNGARAFATNQVPANLTKGTSTTICHAIIGGAFQNMWVAEFGMAEIITDPYSKKKQGLIEVTSFQMIDIGIRYDAAFSLILDAKTS